MKILSNAQYYDLTDKVAMLERYNAQLRQQPVEPRVVEITKVRIEQNVFDALAKELPKPCVPKSELEAGVLLGVQMVLERIRQGWVV